RAPAPARSAGSITEAMRAASRPAASRASEVGSTPVECGVRAGFTVVEVTDDSSRESVHAGGPDGLRAGNQSPAVEPEDISLRGGSGPGALPGGPIRQRGGAVQNPRSRQAA